MADTGGSPILHRGLRDVVTAEFEAHVDQEKGTIVVSRGACRVEFDEADLVMLLALVQA